MGALQLGPGTSLFLVEGSPWYEEFEFNRAELDDTQERD